MYLSQIEIENFRIFGTKGDGRHLHLELQPGLNVLVGENDSGKSAIVDAIRLVLWTTSQEYYRLTEEDFHIQGSITAKDLTISLTFCDLSKYECARFLEWLNIEDGKPCLYVTLKAILLDGDSTFHRGGRNISVTVHSGKDGEGKTIEGKIREFLKTTYLRPLRDAEAELTSGKGSRLSQILQSHPQFREQKKSDFDKSNPAVPATTLVGIMRQAEHLIEHNPVIDGAKKSLNEEYLSEFSIGGDKLEGDIGIAKQAELRYILEKLDLWLRPKGEVGLRTPRGLGYNNILFMSTELLLLAGEQQSALPLLLIEEPEAHLHPQMQLRLMDFLEEKSSQKEEVNPVQILVTTHSPNLASKASLQSIIIVSNGKAYPLGEPYTKLALSDYSFLRRFLDVTKANLFFAKGVVIVEGDAENILVPTLAKLLQRSFSQSGVSVVNVGSRGLFRYARIFERKDNQKMPIRVACIADRDMPPSEADYVSGTKDDESKDDQPETKDGVQESLASEENENTPVRTFQSTQWTFEYDLAYCGLALEVHIAIKLAKRARRSTGPISEQDREKIISEAHTEIDDWKNKGYSDAQIAALVYKPLYKKHASKAETAQLLSEYLEAMSISSDELRKKLPSYLVKAIEHVTPRSPEQ